MLQLRKRVLAERSYGMYWKSKTKPDVKEGGVDLDGQEKGWSVRMCVRYHIHVVD